MFSYQAYDLNIHSDFPLPELLPGGDKTDIYIQKGKLKPPPLEPTSINRQGIEAFFGGTTQDAYLHWQGIATLLAKDSSLARFFPLPSDLLQGTALERHFQQCVQLTEDVDIWKVENPKNFGALESLVRWVEGELGETQPKSKTFSLN
ncbi:hypothetical protein [Coleofasciculus sp.]|uniref:hypothetical protein n=1 Tax=Coleofasciculus sp. TaxID=3100458 RepID=UPI003A30E6E0